MHMQEGTSLQSCYGKTCGMHIQERTRLQSCHGKKCASQSKCMLLPWCKKVNTIAQMHACTGMDPATCFLFEQATQWVFELGKALVNSCGSRHGNKGARARRGQSWTGGLRHCAKKAVSCGAQPTSTRIHPASLPGTFDLLVYAKKECEVPTTWEESDAKYIQNSSEVRLRSFTTKVSHAHMYRAGI